MVRNLYSSKFSKVDYIENFIYSLVLQKAIPTSSAYKPMNPSNLAIFCAQFTKAYGMLLLARNVLGTDDPKMAWNSGSIWPLWPSLTLPSFTLAETAMEDDGQYCHGQGA